MNSSNKIKDTADQPSYYIRNNAVNTILGPIGYENAARFALTLYHRWVLRLQILKDIALKSFRPIGNMLNIYAFIVLNSITFYFFRFVPIEAHNQCYGPEIPFKPSLNYLSNLCESSDSFYIFQYESFVTPHPGKDFSEQNFDSMIQISLAEIRSQINFDLINFYLFTKKYKLAQQTAIECRNNLKQTKLEYEMKNDLKEFLFCDVNGEKFRGFQLACGDSDRLLTLSEKFNNSRLSEYKVLQFISKIYFVKNFKIFLGYN